MKINHPDVKLQDQGLISIIKNIKINNNHNIAYLSTNHKVDKYGKWTLYLDLAHINRKAQ